MPEALRIHPGGRFAALLALSALLLAGPGAVPARAEGPKADAAPAALPVLDARAVDGRFVSFVPTSDGATAVVFYSTECPISNAFSPTLEAVAALGADRPLNMVGICVDADIKPQAVADHAREYRLNFPVVLDRDGSLTARFGAKMTPEAFVFDGKRQLRYRGRIDDTFAARGKRNAHHQTNELRDAVLAVLDRKGDVPAHVEAIGCPVPIPPEHPAALTYTHDVAPILRSNCVSCHRAGQVGPFALETFEQARKRAHDIVNVTESRLMPPWKPEANFGPALKHPKSLTGDEVATLAKWADAGAPEGKAEDLGPAPEFPETWALGTPDLVVETPEFAIPAEGEDLYRCFVIPTDLPEDKYITAVEYHPGNRRSVHHILGYVDISGGGRVRDEKEPGAGYMCFSGPGVPTHGDLGGWAPGVEPSFLPDGVGRSLPKKGDLLVQVHYHPTGKPEADRTQVGLYFSKKPIRQILHWNAALNLGMKLPAGQPNIEVKANWQVPVDVLAMGIAPHMHLLGKDMTMTATLPDGRVLDLIRVNDWDFDWQNNYWFDRPVDLPKGSTLRVVAHFDNSAGNPNNPKNPPVDVKWGEGTTDEMCIGFLAMTKKGQDLTQPGQRDDLKQIFDKQAQDRIKSYEERRRKAARDGQGGASINQPVR